MNKIFYALFIVGVSFFPWCILARDITYDCKGKEKEVIQAFNHCLDKFDSSGYEYTDGNVRTCRDAVRVLICEEKVTYNPYGK